MKKLFERVLFLSFIVIFLSACTNQSEASETSSQEARDQTYIVGVNGESDADIWRNVAERLEEKENITLEVNVFSDGIQPNVAVTDGSILLNAFQHGAYLADYVTNNPDSNLVPVGYTYISPMAAYSNTITSLNDLAEGATIIIANDPTNTSRALLLLEQAGVITLSDDAGIMPTVDDIVENPKSVSIELVAAAQVPRSINDADAIVSSTNVAIDSGLNPKTDGIFVDTDNLSNENISQYKNIIVANEDNADNKVLQTIIAEYQTAETEAVIDEISNGSDQKAWTEDDDTVADFEKILSDYLSEQ